VEVFPQASELSPGKTTEHRKRAQGYPQPKHQHTPEKTTGNAHTHSPYYY
jgi:hypothetical protein